MNSPHRFAASHDHYDFNAPNVLTLRRRCAASDGFTLVELLVTIAIILILMGLSFAVARSVQDNARRAEARHTVTQIQVAASAYYTDYGKWPNLAIEGTASDPEKDQWFGDPATGASMHNNALIFTLRAIPKGANADHVANPRHTEYLELKAAKFSSGKPKNGVFDKGEDGQTPPAEVEGCLYDPWGGEYGIILDTNNDGWIDVSGSYRDFPPDKQPRRKSGVYSMGKDGTLGTKDDRLYRKSGEVSDDVITWE